MKNETPDSKVEYPSPPNEGTHVKGDVNTSGGHFIGRDKIINIGTIKIPLYLATIIAVCMLGIFSIIAYPSVKQFLPKPLAFPTALPDETLILIATFHNTAATNVEAHTKIRRAIESEIKNQGEQNIRVMVEPTELNADQKTQAQALGKLYNANIVIWGEDTGVEVDVNFLNLKEPNFAAASVTITETERTQLANPSAYANFMTNDLPHEVSFFALFALGQSYYLNNQYTLAIERIEAAIAQLSPVATPDGLVNAYFRLGWLYQQLPVQLDHAITAYTKAIQLQPDYAEAYTNRGFAKLSQGKLDEAIADCNKAIQLNPADALAYNNRGLAHFAQNKLNEAITDYDKAIEIVPNFADAYYNRALTQLVQNKLKEAIADYTKAIQLKPIYADGYYNRAHAYATQNKLDEAIADYTKAIDLDPDFATAYYNRGHARYIQNKLNEAIADFDKAIQLQPDYAIAYDIRAVAHADQNKLDEAIVDFDKAIQFYVHDSDKANAYNNRASAHTEQNKLDEAIADYTKAIQLQPDYAVYYKNRGIVYSVQNKRAEALADFHHYLELEPVTKDRAQVEQWIAELEAKIVPQK